MSTPVPDGFAPTTVGDETGKNTTITTDANQVVNGMALVEREKERLVGLPVSMEKNSTSEGKGPDDSISVSSSSPVAIVKSTKDGKRRKERDTDMVDISRKLLEEPVPKKKKKKGGEKVIDSISEHSSSSSSSVATSGHDEDMRSEDESDDEEISFETVSYRTRLFRKVLDFKPTSRVIPNVTYLAIIMYDCLHPLYMGMRYENKEKDEDIAEFTMIKQIVLVPRPVDGFMSYCISNLDSRTHGSIIKGSEQELLFKEATAHIDVVILEEGKNFENEKWGIKVIYQDPYLESCKDTFISLLPRIAKVIPDTSVNTPHKVFAVSCGWSTANPNLYKDNRINILGGIRPFLINSGGVSLLSAKNKEKVAAMICRLIKGFSPCRKLPSPFYHSDPSYRKARNEMASEFLHSLGASIARSEGIDQYFQAEAVSFIMNNFVSFHTDVMNDSNHGMNNTLSYSITVPITLELSQIASVKKAMKMFHLQVGDPLSFAMILYSRRVVHDYIRKLLKVSCMKGDMEPVTRHPSRFLIAPLLKAIGRVDSDMNTNAVWDDWSLIDSYKLHMKCDKDSPQYRGYYYPIIAGFDKMRYWSPVRYLADVMHARNILPMNTTHLMGYICFASFETNGTFLLSGIIDEAMCCVDPRQSAFVKEVQRYGMYAALIFGGQRKNRTIGTGSIYGSSKLPRHQHHNRGSSSFPIAGNESLSFTDKDAIAVHCNRVVKKMISLCSSMCKKIIDMHKNRTLRTRFEAVATEFYDDVKQIAGKGVGHIFALNFCQVAALFGFLPMEMVTWATVNSKTSGAYKAINAFYNRENNKDLSEVDAQKHFNDAVCWISGNVSYQFTHTLAENILCELHRENCEEPDSTDYQQSPKKDVMYMYNHRKGVIHPLYRWKTDIRGRVVLQVLMITKEGSVEGIHDLMAGLKT
jgi:hypothetical protein